MTTKIREELSKYYSFSLRAIGDDYTPSEAEFTAHPYDMKQEESLGADIRVDYRFYQELFRYIYTKDEWGNTYVTMVPYVDVQLSNQMAWEAYTITDSSTLWQDAVSRGYTPEAIHTILTTKLVKKVAGQMVDPTMYLKELDSNFGMVAKRMSQAYQFLNNLKNPRKLARLTAQYFRGSQTRKGLTKRYRRARQAFQLRQRKWATVKVSDAYLEYQFGWKPLMEDTVGLIRLAQNTVVRLKTFRVKVGILPKTEKYDTVGGPISSTDITYNRVYVEDSTGGHAVLRFKIVNPMLRSLAQLALPTYSVWDSIPFSFLADMATNVGDHLKYIGYHWGLELVKGGNYRTAYRNLYTKLEVSPAEHWETNSGQYPKLCTTWQQQGSIYRRVVITQRQIIDDWPDLPWIDKTPGIQSNTGQIITLGALAHQWFAKAASRRFWQQVI